MLSPERLPVGDLLLRAERARQRAHATCRQAARLTLESRLLRTVCTAPGPRYFVIHGEVEHRRVSAAWSRGRLIASPALRQRGEIVVAMGERFAFPGEADAGDPTTGTDIDDYARPYGAGGIRGGCDLVDADAGEVAAAGRSAPDTIVATSGRRRPRS